MTTTELKYQLEILIDRNNVGTILDAIAEVCYEKEQHLLENWQDKVAASHWKEAGDLVTEVVLSIAV
jgi:Tfp pilus assembly major pilin PilA